MKKPVVYTELAYVAALLILALGTALIESGGFGISMVAAPAYVLFLKVSSLFPGFSFGTAEYLMEALVLSLMMVLVRRCKVSYFLSFATAVVYGFLLDGTMALVRLLPMDLLPGKIIGYVIGMLLCSAAISLLFRAYFPPAAYEMFVKEVADKWKLPLSVLKTVYDCSSLALAVVMSLLFFGRLDGIGIGTVICAFVNGTLIRMFGAFFEKIFLFRDRFALRNKF